MSLIEQCVEPCLGSWFGIHEQLVYLFGFLRFVVLCEDISNAQCTSKILVIFFEDLKVQMHCLSKVLLLALRVLSTQSAGPI